MKHSQDPKESFQEEQAWLEDFDPESIDHDESLILEMLRKTPTERLETLQDFVDAVVMLRNGRKTRQTSE